MRRVTQLVRVRMKSRASDPHFAETKNVPAAPVTIQSPGPGVMVPHCGEVLATVPTPYPRAGTATSGRSPLLRPGSGLGRGLGGTQRDTKGSAAARVRVRPTGPLVTLEKPTRRENP